MTFLIDWIRRKLIGPTLLEDIALLPLEASLDDAMTVYGKPAESKVDEEFPEAREHTFQISDYHEVVTWEWRGCIHAIVYFSARGQPDLDLETMIKTYGESQEWTTVNKGYLYRRRDGRIRLWCSAMPAIGVGTEEYFRAESEYKESRSETRAEPTDECEPE